MQRLFDLVFHIFDLFGKMLTQKAIVDFCGTSESRFTSILLKNFILQNPQIYKKKSSISFYCQLWRCNFEMLAPIQTCSTSLESLEVF